MIYLVIQDNDNANNVDDWGWDDWDENVDESENHCANESAEDDIYNSEEDDIYNGEESDKNSHDNGSYKSDSDFD